MSTVVLDRTETLADLLDRLGGIPLNRIRMQPAPGTATEHDLLDPQYGDSRLCELVDGVVVEKGVGYYESRLAAVLIWYLESFLRRRRLGIVVGADAHTRFRPGLVRMPDVAFVRKERLPKGKVPRTAIASLPPDLAVEIMSRSNTEREMNRKRREYFEAGVRLVWQVYPRRKVVRVYSGVDEFVELGEGDTLDGGDVLPGFSLSISEWFERADEP
ncbi:MAG TPA: Uma2 family endonuclease [Planctomycetaceae bacterium]|nr:Uma2 family endonuclease [Planctomycetaceae bacterium]